MIEYIGGGADGSPSPALTDRGHAINAAIDAVGTRRVRSLSITANLSGSAVVTRLPGTFTLFGRVALSVDTTSDIKGCRLHVHRGLHVDIISSS